MELCSATSIIWTSIALLTFAQLLSFVNKIWWIPRSLEQALHKQGLKGPSRLLLLGNIVDVVKARQSQAGKVLDSQNHNILPHILPDHISYHESYGDSYVYWWATEPRVNVESPELLKEVLSKKADSFGKSPIQAQLSEDILGKGTVTANGQEWAYHRKTVAPAFHMEKLKKMTGTFVDCTLRMASKWRTMVKDGRSEAEVDVNEELAMLTSEAIARTAFGDSYEFGKRAFDILNLLTSLHVKAMVYSWIPLVRLLPIKLNREIWKNDKEVTRLLTLMVEDRVSKVKSGERSTYGDDFLGLLLTESRSQNSKFTLTDVIGECKTANVAGQDSTSSMLTWTMFMLASYPEWQDRVRAEAFEVCGDGNPDSEMLGKLKQITMVLNESMRMYPPIGVLYRQCFEDVQLGDLSLPKGTAVSVAVLALHRDKRLWGEDAEEFKPERFEKGVANACTHPFAFMPFSQGPRICVGMNLSLIEAKVALAILLRQFEFRVSPTYKHCPSHLLSLKPGFGMQLLIKPL